MSRCRWERDPAVPGGRYLIPGCYSRAIGGDDAPCQCPPSERTELMRDVMNAARKADMTGLRAMLDASASGKPER